MTNLQLVAIGERSRARILRRAALFLLPLLLLVPVAWLIVRHNFDGLYGQDAFAYYDYASGPLRQALLQGEPFPPFFWPPGYPLLVTLASFLLGPTPLAGQLISLLAGALLPLCTTLLAREALSGDQRWPAWTPLLAGLLVACVPQLWQSSAVVMADTVALLAATAGVWALLRYGQGCGRRWLWLAAACVAYATFTRWGYALVALPCTVYALHVLRQRQLSRALTQAAIAALVVAAVFAPVLIPFLQGAAATDAFRGNFDVYWWSPLNAFRKQFHSADGLLSYRLPNGLYYALVPAHRYFFTPLLAPLLLPGLLAFWQTRRQAKRRGPLLLLLLTWAALIFLFHAGAPYQNFRFTLAYLPPLAIFAALGAAWLQRRLPRAGSTLLAALILTGLLWMVSGGLRLTTEFMARKQADLQTVQWVAQEAQPPAHLLTFGLTLTVEHYSDLSVHDLYFLTPDEMAQLLEEENTAVYVLADVPNLQSQWANETPGANLQWLMQNTMLLEIGQDRQYTLFQVLPPEDAP
jgi:4-amino-4-deoxy-L-arabinose transferase-like glycosyltransferase